MEHWSTSACSVCVFVNLNPIVCSSFPLFSCCCLLGLACCPKSFDQSCILLGVWRSGEVLFEKTNYFIGVPAHHHLECQPRASGGQCNQIGMTYTFVTQYIVLRIPGISIVCSHDNGCLLLLSLICYWVLTMPLLFRKFWICVMGALIPKFCCC